MVTIYCENLGPEEVPPEFAACPNYGPRFFAVDRPTGGGPSVCARQELERFVALLTDWLVEILGRDLSEGGAIVFI